jgi:hypothetical protein
VPTVASANGLPAGWAYELVSHADTNGVDVGLGSGSVDGDHAWLQGVTPIQPDQTTGNFGAYAMTRTATGWHGRELSDPANPTLNSLTLQTADDSSAAIVSRCDFRAVVCFGPVTYDRVSNAGTRTKMFTFLPSVPLGAPGLTIVGGSFDLSRIVAQLPSGQPPLASTDTHTLGRGLYRSDLGDIEYLGIDENGDVLDCGAALANNPPDGYSGQGFKQGGLSADGRTVTFASPDPAEVDFGNCSGPINLYVRRGDETVNISAPLDGSADEGATYVGNTQDGGVVYFVTASQLVSTDDDNFTDIYAYSVLDKSLTRLTSGADIGIAARPRVQVSADGSYIYFVARNAINGHGEDGADNVYVYHQGAVSLITSTTEGFVVLGQPTDSTVSSPLTPNGRHLVFFSNAPLTGQPTNGTLQLFRYSVTSDGLMCISCPGDGAPAVEEPALFPGRVDNRVQSDDGSTVLFDTRAKLLPQDINGTQDVYLWRDGKRFLVSSGHDSWPSRSLGMSADGRTVFFLTYERLSWETTQDTLKVYAARLNGGFARPSVKPACAEDECQGVASPTPLEAVDGTRSYRGKSNRRVPSRLGKISVSNRGGRAGTLALRVRVRSSGRFHIRVTAVRRGRRSSVASRTVRMAEPGVLRTRLRLAKAARDHLRNHRSLRVRITVRPSGGAPRRMELSLHNPTKRTAH